MSEEWHEVDFDTLYDGNSTPGKLGLRKIILLSPRGVDRHMILSDDPADRVERLDEIYAWVREHFGPSMVESIDLGGGNSYFYPGRRWYGIAQNFYFAHEDDAFHFRMRWC